MKDNLTESQSAYALPAYGPVNDWSFIRTREQYLAFVADWKAAYSALSKGIRYCKLMRRYCRFC